MMISTKGRYALRVMLDLAEHNTGDYIPLKDISALNSHALLRELSLAGSTVEDIAALQDLPSLETLRLEHTGVRDLSSLDGFARLREVTVSRDMLPVVWSTEADFTVVLVK